MSNFLSPLAKFSDLDDNEQLDACLTRAYAAFRPYLQAKYGLVPLPQEAKTGGQRIKAIRPLMRVITLLEDEPGDESRLVAVLELWIALLGRMVQYGRDLQGRSAAAMFAFELAAGTAERLDAAVTTWQKNRR